MATPNYSFEKRQRELAKKRKAEEKRQKKLNRAGDAPTDEGTAGESDAAPQPAAPPAQPRE